MYGDGRGAMSRVGKLPIELPSGVEVNIADSKISVAGPKGTLERQLPDVIRVEQEGSRLLVKRQEDSRVAKAFHGLYRTLIANMVTGVTQGFSKDLELVGVGYRASKDGRDLVLNLGFSHPVRITPPDGIEINVTDPTKISVQGIDKELVGQVAANIRKLRKPEPYKGKGIVYKGEVIRRKAGKSAKGGR
jgi:large subunit ribosomal protein L6